MTTPQASVRPAVVAGRFYPAAQTELRATVDNMLAAVAARPEPAYGAIAPHAGLMYSGQCAAHVFKRITVPPVVVILAPNHTGRSNHRGGASAWDHGSFDTPMGQLAIAQGFLAQLEAETDLVAHDPAAHAGEHSVEVELPFIAALAPDSEIAPIVLAWDDWGLCRKLAETLANVVRHWPDQVLLLASSDMTHFESAQAAAVKDREALAYVERLDGKGLISFCHQNRVSMCGRAPAAVVLEATRLLGATKAEVVDYRHSGLITGDERDVVAYAGVVIR